MLRSQFLVFAGLLIALVSISASPANSQTQDSTPDLLLILDASGSMWGQLDGENKIVIARRVLKDLIADLGDDSELGLIAYGHRREGDCRDVETIVPLAKIDRAQLAQTIEGLNPKGKTPLTFSVETAFDSVRSRAEPTTIVLVSDGLETCDGDPCAAVRAAKEARVDFVLHVVGFGIAEGDVSPLECAAQAGGGLYFDVENADQLGEALDQVVRAPIEIPEGRLSVRAVANGELLDVSVRVARADTGEEVAVGRTYTSEDTNPRVIPLEDGAYNVLVKAVGMKGDVQRTFENVEIVDGGLVEKSVDFSSGQLAIKALRNGELADVTVRVRRAGTTEEVASGRTYQTEKTNPKIFELTAGEYDVSIKPVEIANGETRTVNGVAVEGSQSAEIVESFTSGTLRVGATRGGELVDVVVRIADPETNQEAARRRTYASAKTNPASWELLPGAYRVTLKAVQLEGKPEQEILVEVKAGEAAEHMVEFSP